MPKRLWPFTCCLMIAGIAAVVAIVVIILIMGVAYLLGGS